jgi:hypothetical protein
VINGGQRPSSQCVQLPFRQRRLEFAAKLAGSERQSAEEAGGIVRKEEISKHSAAASRTGDTRC